MQPQKRAPKDSDCMAGLVLKNSCADLIHQWVFDSTQLESPRSLINYAIIVMVDELQHFIILELSSGNIAIYLQVDRKTRNFELCNQQLQNTNSQLATQLQLLIKIFVHTVDTNQLLCVLLLSAMYELLTALIMSICR